jgi:hypothetical protein
MIQERAVKRNGRGQIVSYEIEVDENGFPLQEYGVVEFGANGTVVDKFEKESFNKQVDIFIEELEFQNIPQINYNQKSRIFTPLNYQTYSGGTTTTTSGGTTTTTSGGSSSGNTSVGNIGGS